MTTLLLVQLKDLYPPLEAPQGGGQCVPLGEHLLDHGVDSFIHLQVLLFSRHLIELLLAQILRLELQIPGLLMVRPELSELCEVLHL